MLKLQPFFLLIYMWEINGHHAKHKGNTHSDIVALAIPKLCTVIDFCVSCQEGFHQFCCRLIFKTPRARYDMLQRESFVLQQYPEKKIQWTDAGNPRLDVGSHLLHGTIWNTSFCQGMSRTSTHPRRVSLGKETVLPIGHRVTRYGGTLGFCPTSSWPGAVPASTSGRIPARFPGSLLGWNWIQGLKIPFLDVIT